MNLLADFPLSRAHLILLGICAALTLALIYEIAAPVGEYSVDPTAATRSAPLPAAPAPFIAPPAEAFAAINDRSLFDPQRRPVAPQANAAGAAEAAPPPVVLVGIIIDGQNRMALVKSPQTPLAMAVRIGESIGGWQLTVVEPDRIVLHAGTTDDEIRLDAHRANTVEAGAPPQKPPE